MKRTQVIELFANVRNSFVSFFSILMFVALGVGIFLGINWTSPALERAADAVYDQGNFHHVQVSFPYGLTEDDIAQVRQVEGVSSVEAARQAFATYRKGDAPYTFKLQTMPESIDQLFVKEGQLPSRDGELALKESVAKGLGLSVGDTISFEHDADASSGTAATGSASDGDGMRQLTADTFTVTALVESPDYLSLNPMTFGFSTSVTGQTDGLAWVLPSAFDDAQFQEGYPLLQIRSDALQGVGATSFSAEYEQASSKLEERIAELGKTLAPARYDDLHGQAQEKVDEGKAQLAEGEEKVQQGEQAITEGTQKVEEGRSTLEQKRTEGQQKLDAAYQELMQYEQMKAEGEQKLAEARAKVEEGREAIEATDAVRDAAKQTVDEAHRYERDLHEKLHDGEITREEYNRALDRRGKQISAEINPLADLLGRDIPIVSHENYRDFVQLCYDLLSHAEEVPVEIDGERMTVGEAREKLEQGERDLAAAEDEYNQKVAQLEEGWREYHEGQELLEQETARGEQELSDAEAQIQDVQRQVDEGKQKIDEMKPQLDAGEKKLAAMKQYQWTVMGRSSNAGAVQVSTFSGVTGRLSFSMAALFIIVGLLVSYSAVSRIVHEQITQIGTKKALGLRGREITASYLLYSAQAVLAGAIIGTVVGVILVEGIISRALGAQFFMGAYPPYFNLALFVVVTLLELVLVTGATWLACHSILREHAVELLKGEKPPEAKERFYERSRLWGKLPLFTQTIVNNCVNDKRRVFSTIVGVAGCTALIVTAITLNDDVLDSYDMHYDHVYGFNVIAYPEMSADDDADEKADATAKAADALADQGATVAQVLHTNYLVNEPDGTHGMMTVVVPQDDEAFSQVYHVNAQQGEPFDPKSDGVWVARAYAEHEGAKPGDQIALTAADGAVHNVRIAGFMEFYLTYNELVMGRELYESEFGTFAPNVVLANSNGKSVDELQGALGKTGLVNTMIDDKQLQSRNFTNFSSISRTVVLIYLALAALMALVVLLNLNVMFIEEKKRELIVLMINGFSTRHAKRYIYNDSIVLTVIGILLGLVLGAIMGSVTVGAIEPNTASFFKGIAWRAIAVGAAGSALLAFIMSAVALRRIPRFNLTDINKF